MTMKKGLIAATLAAMAAGSQAYPTWQFEVQGAGLSAAGGTEGCSPDHPDQCIHATKWFGTLSVETTGSADGTYGIGEVEDNQWVPGGIVRVTLDSNVGATDVDAQAYPGTQFFPGAFPYAVTIVDHRITAIEWTSEDRPDGVGLLQIDGMAVTFQTNGYHENYADVTGTLTAIPEPAGIALVLLGLAVAGGCRTRPGRALRTG